jgi:hypothetical protein
MDKVADGCPELQSNTWNETFTKHYATRMAATATSSPRNAVEGLLTAAASDRVLVPQHGRLYVTPFALAAASKTLPGVGP